MNKLYLFLCFCVFICYQTVSAISIDGTVKDEDTQLPIQGAIISLKDTGLTTITDQNGYYSFGFPVSSMPLIKSDCSEKPFLKGNNLYIKILSNFSNVSIEAYSLNGKIISQILKKKLEKGDYIINPFIKNLAVAPLILKVQVEKDIYYFKAPVVTTYQQNLLITKSYINNQNSILQKKSAALDSIFAWAVGYNTIKKGIDNFTGTYNLTLKRVIPQGNVLVIQTSQAGDRLSIKPNMAFINDDGSALPTITINPATTYQPIVGFGAAFTETAVYNLCKISKARKNEVLNAFFNPYTGAGYTLCRTTINSCDFSLGVYSYDDTPNDYNLDNFNMSREMKWMIPTIKEALRIPGSNFKLFASPWAPPAWMKTTNNMLGGGELRTQCYDSWSNYFVKYINTMKANGITIWGITIQNEPEYSPSWEGCRYTPQQERDFLKNSLGPIFERNKLDVKIMIWDHNKDHIVNWAKVILGDAAAAKYAWGVAYHRYAGDLFDSLSATHDAFPNYYLIGTENSVRDSWAEAERMAHEIIGDLTHWSSGYLTWNLTTDFLGGPYHNRDNGCVGPIVVDSASDSAQYFPNHYYMVHFSRYLRPGAVRISHSYNGPNLEICAFKNLNNSIVVVVLNRSANAVNFKLKHGNQIISPTIPAHALMNFIYFL
jgi:glucosylceramidase